MEAFKNTYTQKVYEILLPLVGDIMAKSILQTKLKANGLTVDNLAKSNLPKLADDIKTGMIIFIGSDNANRIAQKIESIL